MRPTADDGLGVREFVDMIGDACLVVDADLTVAAANSFAGDLYRRLPEDLAGANLEELCAEGDQASVISEIASCNGSSRTFTAAQLRGDGSRFVADISAQRCHIDVASDDDSVVLLMRERAPSPCGDELELRSALLEGCLDPMIAHTIGGDLVYANKAALRMWGVTSIEQMNARGPYSWVALEEREKIPEHTALLQVRHEAKFTTNATRGDGTTSHHEVSARLIESSRGRIVVSAVRDISDRLSAEEMVRYLAYHDTLTGVANRTMLADELDKALARAERHGDTTGMVFIDLDDFKPINDTMGHAIGDHALRIVAERIHTSVRQTDVVARMGGDEFVVLLPRLSDPKDLPDIARKIAREVSMPMRIGDRDVSVTVSVGCALHEPGESAESFMIRADLAMYQSRQTGIAGWDVSL
jgi:diguanylate cyclase (GGDEF)-like protein/PAS domain S-box-containing protein